MEARGLIERAPDPADVRGCLLVLTTHGLQILDSAAPAHVDSVRRHFIDRLTAEDLATLEGMAEKVLPDRD